MTQPPPPSSPHPPPQRSGCLTAFMIVAGIVLLLPGLCALLIVGSDPMAVLRDSTGLMALASFLAIGAGGVVLIWIAARGPR